MVVILVLAVDNICEPFTKKTLTWSQGNPIFLSLMGTHKKYIANESEFESYFGGGQQVCVCVAIGNH